MLLRSIEIQGFKSFADKTTLKFGKGITAVVGPNGSGKSNISDAVRWVLGEQSTKNLRGQSMEDVIFGGTADRRPHGFCEVTLIIDNVDRSLNFDNDTVAVTRRYYRSHESEYMINGVSVRLKDINELFMDTGLGRDGYSMIGQGKIDSIIGSKSQERRDIFEEASGISKYRYRKLDAERKLAAADDNMLRLKDIFSELESRIKPLEEQSNKAEKFLEFASQKRELEIGLWLHTLNGSKEAVRNQESKIAVCEAQYSDLNKQLEQYDADIEANSEEFAKLTSDIENMRTTAAGYEEQCAVLKGNIAVLENNIEHNNATVQRIRGEIDELNNSDIHAADEITARNSEIEAKNEQIALFEKKVNEANEELNSLISDSESISRNIEEFTTEMNHLAAEFSDAKVKEATAASAIEEINNRRDSLNVLLAQKKEAVGLLNGEMNETKSLLDSIEENITSCENSLKGYALRKDSKQGSADALKENLDELKLNIESKKRKIQLLKELEKNMEGFNHSVKTVMSEYEKGVLRGIYGPVSRLIHTDKKYAVAVEVALGNALQNIVVKTEADAKRAIEFLKKNANGRATFLPVDTIKSKKYETEPAEDMFGFLGVASDIVETDKEYKEIIKFLLGGTVVADDIDSAAAIAKKTGYKLKIVTLDGQVVNPGGSLTGGSLGKNVGILSRAGEISSLNDEIDRLEKKLNTAEEEYNKALEELSSVQADIVSAEGVLKTANEDKIRALAELKRIDDLLKSESIALSNAEEESENSQQKTTELSGIIASCGSITATIIAKQQELQSQIDKMSDGRDSISEKREEITNRLTSLRLDVFTAQKDKENLAVSLELIKKASGDRVNRIAALNSEIETLLSDNGNIEKEIIGVNTQIAQMQSQKSASEELVVSMIAKREELEKNSHEFRANEKELSAKREALGGELARLNERKESILRELDEVVKRLYDEYQLTRTQAEEMGIVIENIGEAKKRLSELKGKIRSLGNVNVAAIEEYKEVSERYNFMSEQIADIEKSREELTRLINQLTKQMQELFCEGFAKISQVFSKTFTELFGGGHAELVLTDPDNVLESGIDIVAKLPGKNVPSLDGLSGGEKAIVALSIYFSIMKVNAPPFCFLDEVDTALDDINVDRIADYMGRPDFNTQFICITHRRGTMESADMLYGVTMQEKGVTKLLELDVSELEKTLKIDN